MQKTTQKPRKTISEIVPEQFPQIWQVAKNIAYDNGMINHFNTEDEYLGVVATIIADHPVIEVIKLEAFLRTKNNTQLSIIAAGEQSKMEAELQDAPDYNFADKLFNSFMGK